MRISSWSFYWQMPVIFAAAFLFLCQDRFLLSQKYFETSILMLSLTIGTSVYFFGRSHENNIINIAAGLLTVLFLLLDLLIFHLKNTPLSRLARWLVHLLACAIILTISFQYADRAMVVLRIQNFDFKNHLFYFPVFDGIKNADYPNLKTVTLFSPKVIFISREDFYYYYEGKYPLPQNYNPFTTSWYLMKDQVAFLNAQLQQGYYIIVPAGEISYHLDIIKLLKFSHFTHTNNFLIISNSPFAQI